MPFNANDFFPYNEIKKVTVDGQEMVRIPRIYVKAEELKEGPFKGKFGYFMSKTPGKGYHIHPAFMNKGVAMSALDLSCYEASKDAKDANKPASIAGGTPWDKVNRMQAIDFSTKRNVAGGTEEQQGWHCWDIYCQHLLARLMLFEFGTAGIGIQEDGTDFVYRGIHHPAGNPQAPIWLPGLSNINDQIYIYDRNGNFTMVNTGVTPPDNGWPTSFSFTSGNNFDLGDVFLAGTTSQVENEGTCSDYQRLKRNGVTETGYFTGYRGGGTQDPADAHGMFAISQETSVGSSGYGSPSAVWGGNNGSIYLGPLRFRLARFVP